MADASFMQINNAFAFQAVIRPATPTGLRMVTVVFPQLSFKGISWSAFSAAAKAAIPPLDK